MAKVPMVGGKAQAKKSDARYNLRKTTICDHKASVGFAQQRQQGVELKRQAILDIQGDDVTARPKKTTAAANTGTSTGLELPGPAPRAMKTATETVTTEAREIPTKCVRYFAKRTPPFAAAGSPKAVTKRAVTTSGGSEVTTAKRAKASTVPTGSARAAGGNSSAQPTPGVEDLKLVKFSKGLGTTVSAASSNTSVSNSYVQKRTKKIMSKGARRRLRQQQLEEERAATTEVSETENESQDTSKVTKTPSHPPGKSGLQVKQTEKQSERKTVVVVPKPSASTSAPAQRQTPSESSTTSAAATKACDSKDRPLVAFGRPERKTIRETIDEDTGKRYTYTYYDESTTDSSDDD